MFEKLVWAEKYRPRKVVDTILPNATRNRVQEFMSSGDIPNMLFTGTAGTGKTTLARAIADELGAELLYVNASLQGNIDMIRTDITQFVTTMSMDGSRKIVFLDEADYLSSGAQPALRGFMDEFSKNVVFILTCNYPQRLIEPLISRLEVIDFKFAKPSA